MVASRTTLCNVQKAWLAGRMDDMEKLNGDRLDLREIELCMERFPGVEKAVVDVLGEGADAILCAWFTSETYVEPRLLRKHLSLSLPAYMVPARIMERNEIPYYRYRIPDKYTAKRIESHSVFLFLKYFSRPALLCDSQKAKTLYLRFESLYRR